MALQGTIDAFPRGGRAAAAGEVRKTGRLIVEGDRSTAALRRRRIGDRWRVQGVDDSALVDVVAELLRYRGFVPVRAGLGGPAAPGSGDLPALVDAAGSGWRPGPRSEAVVPSMSHRLSLCSEISDEGVHLSAADWPVVVAAGAGFRVGGSCPPRGTSEIRDLFVDRSPGRAWHRGRAGSDRRARPGRGSGRWPVGRSGHGRRRRSVGWRSGVERRRCRHPLG